MCTSTGKYLCSFMILLYLTLCTLDVHFGISGFNRLDVEVFVNKNQGIPSVIKFHPYEGHVAVADKDGIWSVTQGLMINIQKPYKAISPNKKITHNYLCFSCWDWEQGTKINYIYNENLKNTKISAMNFINPHDESLLLCGTGKSLFRHTYQYLHGLHQSTQWHPATVWNR